MCLILLAASAHPDWPLVVVANRDEFTDRPTRPLHYWKESSGMLAGRDGRDGGTWMGLHPASGRFAAITNYRDPGRMKKDAPSRGRLIPDYLESATSPEEWIAEIRKTAGDYNGFNLLFGSPGALFHYNNVEDAVTPVSPGFHGLSNHSLDTPWPKVVTGTRKLSGCVGSLIEPEALFDLLADKTLPPDDTLPETGMGLKWERILAPLHIDHPRYATRSASVLLVHRSGETIWIERTHANGEEKPFDTRVALSLPV